MRKMGLASPGMAYPRAVRELARRVAPGAMADRARRYERGRREQVGVTAIAGEMMAAGRTAVEAGPFRGLRYPPERIGEVDAPVAKLLGIYELEIAAVFAAELARDTLTSFIDIGCADGYYAVGMPVAQARLTSHGFDIAGSARDLCAEVAALNGVAQRVRIAGRFSADSLGGIGGTGAAGAVVLCDIEGAEAELLDEALIARLAAATVVVEVHEYGRPGLSDALRGRFAATHHLTRVDQQPRDVPDVAPAAVSEFRPSDLHWLVCRPARSA
jgi:hypothetical protein